MTSAALVSVLGVEYALNPNMTSVEPKYQGPTRLVSPPVALFSVKDAQDPNSTSLTSSRRA